MVDVLRVPVLTGHKTARERFAGADQTWTCEGMMGDGKALQMGTSHELGQNFARPFDITYSNASGSLEYVWQTSWGVSTRLVGALVMAHGDDFGLRLPPALAPAQVVVMVVKDDAAVGEAAARFCAELGAAGHRVRLDDRTDTSFGRRSVDWELKGVPVRVEVGPRDLAEGNVTVVVRHRGRSAPSPWTAWRPRSPRRSSRRTGTCWPRRPPSARPARTTPPRWRRPSRRGRSASPGCPWRPSGPTARTVWRSTR